MGVVQQLRPVSVCDLQEVRGSNVKGSEVQDHSLSLFDLYCISSLLNINEMLILKWVLTNNRQDFTVLFLHGADFILSEI